MNTTEPCSPFCVWWAKRDLRLTDNAAFDTAYTYAHNQGLSLLALYIHEPKAITCVNSHPRHFRFLSESLKDLSKPLAILNVQSLVVYGDAGEVFLQLLRLGLKSVYSHEETGLLWTFDRDRAVKKILSERMVDWKEMPTNGVVRRLPSRDHWKAIYDKRMSEEVIEKKDFPLISKKEESIIFKLSQCNLNFHPWSRAELIFGEEWRGEQQSGGESIAHAHLRGFISTSLSQERYLSSISNPTHAAFFGSRLSPYLAFGCISSKQVLSAVKNLQLTSRNISAFRSRLAWRCHFIQKLENFPELECKEVNKEYNGLRPVMTPEEFERWRFGKTGFPFVDACLRSVHATGFLNFRMRAMLMSFATHAMWRDWRVPSNDLARAFLDFEPGIHFAQVQMQAAVTGNNTVRVYSPLKQGFDNDLKGIFIKKWVPELRAVDARNLHDLEDLPSSYPKPIINLNAALNHARKVLFEKMKDPNVRILAKEVQNKLGSRKKSSNKFGSVIDNKNKKQKKIDNILAQHLGTLFDDPHDD